MSCFGFICSVLEQGTDIRTIQALPGHPPAPRLRRDRQRCANDDDLYACDAAGRKRRGEPAGGFVIFPSIGTGAAGHAVVFQTLENLYARTG